MKNTTYPVVLFLYQRPQATRKIIDLVIKAKIKKIYIFADGPKSSQEKIITSQLKSLINHYIKKYPKTTFIPKFSSNNIGLKDNIISGLNQVFAKESAAIILEDDCIPSLDFFKFTTQMLTKYKNNPKIMSVTGTSLNFSSQSSYDFSRYIQVWGWGTWARAWQLYDPSLSAYKKTNQPFSLSTWYWQNIFSLTKKGIIDTWCYQWTHAHITNQGLTIIPATNLISNVGFDRQATHTKFRSSVANMKTSQLKFPLTHPKIIRENTQLSLAIERKFYTHPVPFLGMIKILIKSFLKKL